MRFRSGVASRTSDGSLVGGDMVSICTDDGALGVVVVDIAGNGWSAAADAWRTRSDVDAAAHLDPMPAMRAMHERMVRTRGAVGVAARFDPSGEMRFVGVGDVRLLRLRAGASTAFPMANGQLGGVCSTLTERSDRADPGDLYVFVTDGIRATLDLAGLSTASLGRPDAIASTVLRRWHREHDDATCVVVSAEW